MAKEIIFLCGFMGCGKTTVGRIVAKSQGIEFIDTDDQIVAQEGMDIPSIFEKYGEPYFRELERLQLLQLDGGTKKVVATGGGCLVNPLCAGIAKEKGIIIYIKQEFRRCYQRIKGDKNRPLAALSSKEELNRRYNQRDVIYKSIADVIIDDKKTSAQVAKEIVKVVNIYKNEGESL